MYLFRIFYSFLPLRNPIGFGASDLLILAIAVLMTALLLTKAWLAPYLHKLSAKTMLCMAALFASVIVLRLSLLAVSPPPIPSGADDFGYLLLADTIAHLRLANPPHPLYQFFESVFILQQPAYASIYPLGQGFVLAVGQLAGNPWIGVLLSGAAFCALCYWMLRGWIAPIWALAGGVLAVIQFGPLNPWMNSYWGGYVSASAGCLAFGALPRFVKQPRTFEGLLLGFGIALQMLSRPFEAGFLLAVSALYLGFRLRTIRPLASTLAVVTLALLFIGLQNEAVTKSWTTMPYVLSRYQYGVPTTFTFQPNPIPHRHLTVEQELDYQAQASIHGDGHDSLTAYVQRFFYRFRYLRFFLLPPLILALLTFIPHFRQRRYLWVFGTIILFALGSNVYPYFYPHYVAAITCLLLLLAAQGLAHMGIRARSFVLVLSIGSFAFWFGLYAAGNNDLLRVADYQSWDYLNRGDPQGRQVVKDQLPNTGKQLVFVRYAPYHRFEEWVHNDADIDHAQTVWANDLGAEENQKLLRYYPDRKAWLLQPDVHPPALMPYPTVH